MQQTIDFPSPLGADTDTVITALETAAVFHAKGDGREAMRWLRRAAESASDAGDDTRALSLSRIAADLQEELNAVPSRAATPPPLPSAPSAPAPESRPQLSYPPPPSSRAPRPSTPPRISQPPRPSYNGAAHAAVSAAPPLPALQTNGVSAEAEATPLAPSAAETPAPSTAPVEPIRLATPTPARAEPATVSSAPAGTGARHAARVAVSISTSKAGYLELRLLAEGEAPRLGASEALLVMLDPNSTLLAR
jgi:hypothetical protein